MPIVSMTSLSRRKKKATESKKKTPEMEEETPQAGHNGPAVELSDDQKRALFLMHKRDYQRALSAKKEADATLKHVCKLAKSECGPHVVAEIKDAISLEQPGGPEALQATIEAKHRIARWLALPVGAEPSLFHDVAEVPYERGKSAGLSGGACVPGGGPNTTQYERYMEGFHDGQAVLAAGGFRKLDVIAELPHADVSKPPFNDPVEF